MNVLNIHIRKIVAPKQKVIDLYLTLGSTHDKMWPCELWPPLRFKNGLNIGAAGGHGPIRYKILEYDVNGYVEFEFQKPNGFEGTHQFVISENEQENFTEIKHIIRMKTHGLDTWRWIFMVRPLHDALIEDAFDKIQNQLENKFLNTKWVLWVKILRALLK